MRTDPADDEQLDGSLLFTRERSLLMGADSRLGRRASRGELVRLLRGAYVSEPEWRALDRNDRYKAQVLAVAGTRMIAPVFSSWSAAALWGLPIVGPWPREVHVVSERAAGGRSDPGIRRHAVGVPEDTVLFRSGAAATSVARTVVDVAAQGSFVSGVATADYALRERLVTKDELISTWNKLLPFRGSRQARGVIAFANPLSGSVQESVSLVTMARLRFPRPLLQQEFVRPDGRSYFVDFWWKQWRCIGETDGRIKYSDPAYLRGRTPAQALWEEKEREDWLRTQSNSFGRWPWAVANSLPALGRRLSELGLPRLAPGHPDGFPVFPRW